MISDTHLPSVIRQLDELGPQMAGFLASVDLILHAGDVTAPSVLEWCGQFGPILVTRGNNDLFEHPRMEDVQIFDAEGWRVGMVHQLRPESRPIPVLLDHHLGGERVDVLIAGDTHLERLEYRDQVVFLNPGSPTLPHHKEYRLGTVGLLELEPAELRAEIRLLGHTPGSPNPGRARRIALRRGADGIAAQV
ncbi:MAG: metallophosphoesterase family protein [Proteobacteria bacterium]|nr:metallophosphoesterase family protein [Pseudomonadota bacterium]